MIKLRVVLFIVAATLLSQPCFAYRSITFNGVERREVIKEDNLKARATFADYDIRVYEDKELRSFGVLQIFKGGELVFEEQNHRFEIGLPYYKKWDDLVNLAEVGQDVTGDGEPNLVIDHYSGGAHCCSTIYIFSIGEQFRFVDAIEVEHGFKDFKDINGDGSFELIGYDWTFAYWNASFVDSPAPQVILSLQHGSYQIDSGLMKKPLDTVHETGENYLREDPTEIEELCSNDIWAWRKDDVCVTSDLWRHMLELIYAGHSDRAFQFLHDHWRGNEQAKQNFLNDFKTQLAMSNFAKALSIDLTAYYPDVEDESQLWELRFMKEMKKRHKEVFEKYEESTINDLINNKLYNNE